MKIESHILLTLGIFFGIITLVYWFWSYEDAGTMMLLGSCLLGFLPGGYYFFWHRRMKARLEDTPDASIAEGAGPIDSFPGSSIWPFVLGMGAFFSALALVFGMWLMLPGATLIVTALIGVTAESRRGGNI